ncbi:uncharacterized protein TrAtP1_001611 [Trichoderma atroviride]|uniref:uncharacterized protein n=1 Tax=Hypocrea atroviridis TaxID=63577 RepID=UPI003323F778|nr:hypothetical protein TrAtP1_001611 [Trichoderma atroviride]
MKFVRQDHPIYYYFLSYLANEHDDEVVLSSQATSRELFVPPSQLRLHAIGSDAQLSEQKACKEPIAVCGPKRPRQEMRRQIATYKKMH